MSDLGHWLVVVALLLLPWAVGYLATFRVRISRRRRPSSCSWHYCHANHQHTPHK